MSFVAYCDPVLESKTDDVQIWLWEPGDMTRYRFIVARQANDSIVFAHYDSTNSCAFSLPRGWENRPISGGYIQSQTGRRLYEANVYADFLNRLAEGHRNAAA